jgi:hypothetical protein
MCRQASEYVGQILKGSNPAGSVRLLRADLDDGNTNIPTKWRNVAMKSYKSVVGLSLLLAAMAAVVLPASAAQLKAKTAVLVHGAFADGSCWQKVIPYLEKAGLKVIAVQNPLDSLDNDVAATKRAIRNAEGPVVLVGHS